MEKAMRRRRTSARQKEGVYKSYDNEAGKGSHRKRPTKRTSGQERWEGPPYRNLESSMHDEVWNPRHHAWEDRYDQYDRGSHSARNDDRTDRPRDRNWFELDGWDRGSSKEQTEQRYPRHDEDYRTRRHRRGPSVREDESEYYFSDDHSLYGEHPDSRGFEEYRGINKRHPGLLGHSHRAQNFDQRYGKNEEGLMRKLDEERLYRLGRKKRPRNHRTSTRLAISDYEHRRQFETPFHPMQIYDPMLSEYRREGMDAYLGDDHIYRYEGYQHSGNPEGFGGRQGSRQQGHDWLDEDEYREGHAPRYRGYGKYGSR